LAFLIHGGETAIAIAAYHDVPLRHSWFYRQDLPDGWFTGGSQRRANGRWLRDSQGKGNAGNIRMFLHGISAWKGPQGGRDPSPPEIWMPALRDPVAALPGFQCISQADGGVPGWLCRSSPAPLHPREAMVGSGHDPAPGRERHADDRQPTGTRRPVASSTPALAVQLPHPVTLRGWTI
jgi:hypothetical protein